MAGENEQVIIEVKEAVNALRETVEKYGQESAEFKEMVDRTEKALVADEKAHQEYTAKQVESDKKAAELEERVKEFETRMVEYQTSKGEAKTFRDEPEYKALSNYFRYDDISEEDTKTLQEGNKTMRMDNDTTGGFLTTTEFDNTIIKSIEEISPVRQVARVRKTSKKTLEIPKRTAIMEASYEGEAAAGDDDQSVYGAETLTAYRLTVTVPFTRDLMMDSAFDLEAEINADVITAFAKKEGNKFVLGTGSKQPEGFLANAEIIAGAQTSQTTITISGDDLLLMTGELKQGYSPMYAFNRGTLAFLRTLKASTSGVYIFQASLAPNVPNTIGGEPYMVFQDMPVYTTVGNFPVIYGDFLRGYTITDRTGMEIVRDPYAKKRQAIIEITFHRWNTGSVTLAEAFVALKIKA